MTKRFPESVGRFVPGPHVTADVQTSGPSALCSPNPADVFLPCRGTEPQRCLQEMHRRPRRTMLPRCDLIRADLRCDLAAALIGDRSESHLAWWPCQFCPSLSSDRILRPDQARPCVGWCLPLAYILTCISNPVRVPPRPVTLTLDHICFCPVLTPVLLVFPSMTGPRLRMFPAVVLWKTDHSSSFQLSGKSGRTSLFPELPLDLWVLAFSIVLHLVKFLPFSPASHRI